MIPDLSAWSNFYVMVGSAAAGLTGLMFVVIALISQIERAQSSEEGLAAFGTPTVMHFCAALLVAAILSAPWHSLLPIVILVAIAGAFGMGYIARAIHRTTRLTEYRPDLSDWISYHFVPLIAYAAIFAGAIVLLSASRTALFFIAAGAVALIFVGIRNAWDTVTYLAVINVNHSNGGPESLDNRDI
ncbi:MAG: hypothetical protein JO233_09050 [Candidatus Eremiobacteraeota bacterium]|nr:hypothetical protein [Candidatus Eremiobacteraeota bacterium]